MQFGSQQPFVAGSVRDDTKNGCEEGQVVGVQAYSGTLSRRNFRRLIRRFKATLGKFGQNVVPLKATLGDLRRER